MQIPKLPKISPTILHWASLAALTFIGGVVGYIQKDPTIVGDVTDSSKVLPTLLGALGGGLAAVALLVQRSVLPNVTANAHAENLETARVKNESDLANSQSSFVSRQTADTPVDQSLPKIPKANPSSFPKGGAT
jgi:hypothetical protein